MHKLNLVIILFLISMSSWAQGMNGANENITLQELNEVYYNNKFFNLKTVLPEDIRIDFQKHLFEEQRHGEIYTIQGDTITTFFKYNIEDETLEAGTEGKFYPYSTVAGFKFFEFEELEEVSFTNFKIFDRKGYYGGFLQDIASSPDVKLRYYLVFLHGEEATLPYMESTFDRVEIFTEILIKMDDYVATMPTTKKEFYELFPEKIDSLKKYAKKNKLSFTDPEDIGEMVSWVRNEN